MMQSESEDLRHDTPQEAAKLWGGNSASLRLLSQTQNSVYRFEDAATGNGKILRITPREHRDRDNIEAELDFLTYLKSEGCDVAAPLRSCHQNLVEPVGEAGNAHAAVFEEIIAPPVKWGRDEENR